MSVVFEEENFSYNGQNTQSAQYENKMNKRKNPLNQFLMVGIIIICLIGAFVLPSYINPKNPADTIYIEDITEIRMNLIPEEERADFINSLPSRKK